jgi:hypothetical protein
MWKGIELVDAGFVHLAESPEGWPLIYLSSLLNENQFESTPLHP